MLSIKKLVLSIVAAISLVGMTSEVVKSQSINIVVVPGTTNRGDRLVFTPSSVTIDTDSKNRKFDYAVIKRSGEKSINIGAYTPWCLRRKVKLDSRAVDTQVFGLTMVYTGINPSEKPGWFVDGRYVVANSVASRNLLKYVCAIDTSNNLPPMETNF
jgi:hypothetical protein